MPNSDFIPEIVRCAQKRKSSTDPCQCGHHIIMSAEDAEYQIDHQKYKAKEMLVNLHERAKMYQPDSCPIGRMSNEQLRQKYYKVLDPLAKWYQGDSSQSIVRSKRTMTMLEKAQVPGESGRPLMEELMMYRYNKASPNTLIHPGTPLQYPAQWRSSVQFQNKDPLGQPEIWSILNHYYVDNPDHLDDSRFLHTLKTTASLNEMRTAYPQVPPSKLIASMQQSRNTQRRAKSVSPTRGMRNTPTKPPSSLQKPQQVNPNDAAGVLDMMRYVSAKASKGNKNKGDPNATSPLAGRALLRALAEAKEQSRQRASMPRQRQESRPATAVNEVKEEHDDPAWVRQVGEREQREFLRMFKEAVISKYNSVQRAFRWMDYGSKGGITPPDLIRACDFFGFSPPQPHLDALMETLDLDGDGIITYSEYAKTMGASALEERDYFQVATRSCIPGCNERLVFAGDGEPKLLPLPASPIKYRKRNTSRGGSPVLTRGNTPASGSRRSSMSRDGAALGLASHDNELTRSDGRDGLDLAKANALSVARPATSASSGHGRRSTSSLGSGGGAQSRRSARGYGGGDDLTQASGASRGSRAGSGASGGTLSYAVKSGANRMRPMSRAGPV